MNIPIACHLTGYPPGAGGIMPAGSGWYFRRWRIRRKNAVRSMNIP